MSFIPGARVATPLGPRHHARCTNSVKKGETMKPIILALVVLSLMVASAFATNTATQVVTVPAASQVIPPWQPPPPFPPPPPSPPKPPNPPRHALPTPFMSGVTPPISTATAQSAKTT